MHSMHLYNFYKLLMAAVHFNKNYECAQAKTESRNEWIQIVYILNTSKGFHSKPVPVPKITACL